jgi:hypothetical protein
MRAIGGGHRLFRIRTMQPMSKETTHAKALVDRCYRVGVL